MGFDPKEIKQQHAQETKGKLRAPKDRQREIDRENLSDALQSGDIKLFKEALGAIGFHEGSDKRVAALDLFKKTHGYN